MLRMLQLRAARTWPHGYAPGKALAPPLWGSPLVATPDPGAVSALALRQQAVLQADSQNLDYVRHVIVKFIELEGTDESDQLFEVIATVLQFEEKDVLRLVKALAERKAAARGRLNRLFGL